jgi:hypothetical protein
MSCLASANAAGAGHHVCGQGTTWAVYELPSRRTAAGGGGGWPWSHTPVEVVDLDGGEGLGNVARGLLV